MDWSLLTPGAHASLEWVLGSRNSFKDDEMAFTRLAVKIDFLGLIINSYTEVSNSLMQKYLLYVCPFWKT